MTEETPLPTPTSADACLMIARSLMLFQTGTEDKFYVLRTIEALIKKLKDKADELENLITAVTTNGSHPSTCVTIQRTLDGRLQVAGRKGVPHVIYVRIWRWSDVTRSELKPIPSCQYAYNLKRDLVCVNPYHYDRVVSSGVDLPSLDLTTNAGLSTVGPSTPESNIAGSSTAGLSTAGPSIAGPSIVNQLSNSNNSEDVDMSNHNTNQNYDMELDIDQSNIQRLQETYCNNTGAPIPIVVEQEPPDNQSRASHTSNPQNTDTKSILELALLIPKSQKAHTSANLKRQTNVPNQFQYTVPISSNLFASASQRPSISSTLAYTQAPGSSNSFAPVQQRTSTVNTLTYMQRDNLMNVNVCKTPAPLSTQPLPEHWCSIAYFELDSQVGESFKVSSRYTSANVDGYVAPSVGNRFCLGALSNIHRTEQSEKTRLYIGRGIVLELRNEGDIHLRCESTQSVFVQSHYLDVQANRPPGTTVHKIHPNVSLKVFDLATFYSHMRSQVTISQAATVAQAAAFGSMLPHHAARAQELRAAAGISVDDLRRLCILRVSFVKGWGLDYPRQQIKETPCWIEIHLHRALQLLDETLHNGNLQKK